MAYVRHCTGDYLRCTLKRTHPFTLCGVTQLPSKHTCLFAASVLRAPFAYVFLHQSNLLDG